MPRRAGSRLRCAAHRALDLEGVTAGAAAEFVARHGGILPGSRRPEESALLAVEAIGHIGATLAGYAGQLGLDCGLGGGPMLSTTEFVARTPDFREIS